MRPTTPKPYEGTFKIIAGLAVAGLLVAILGCPYVKTTPQDQLYTAKTTAGSVLESATVIGNAADAALKAAIVVKDAQVQADPNTLTALKGYDCPLDVHGDPVPPQSGTPDKRPLSGPAASMCYYDVQMLPYTRARLAVHLYRDLLLDAAKAVDAAGSPAGVQSLIMGSLDHTAVLLRAIKDAGVAAPPEVQATAMILCAAVKSTWPASTCSIAP